MNIRKLTVHLHTADFLVIALGLILSLINLVFATRIPIWWQLIVVNCVVSALICWLGYERHATGSKLLRFIHNWYVAPVAFFSFKELYFMIKPIHFGRDYDDLLIAIDRLVFGVNPTEWIMRFANPYLTEVLQIAYTSFYFLFLIIGHEMYRRHNPDLFHYFMFICVYGFFLSYLGYFFLPAVGPRFTLHDFSALNRDLPGVLLTPYLRWFVNAGGSVPMGVPNDVAIAGTQRDVFPSGHTMMTLVLIYLSAKFRARVRHVIFVIGTLLIIATVYQRYHYVVDLVAGAIFMVLCVATSPHLYSFIKRRYQTMESRFPAAWNDHINH
jgi:membrane-associated phospholipid phosphatase